MSEKTGLWVNIGSSGRIFPGFVNYDIANVPGVQRVDVRLGIPLPDGSAKVVVASHVLEHLHPFTELPNVLKEIHRVLAPGGLLRAAVPDLELLAKAYATNDWDALSRTQRVGLRDNMNVDWSEIPAALKFSVIAFGNNSGSAAYDGHQSALDAESLLWLLQRAGFTSAREVEANRETQLGELLTRYRDIDAPEQVIVEAIK